MPQNEVSPRAASDQGRQAVRPGWRQDEKWPPQATLLFVVAVSLTGWAAAIYPILN